MQLKYYEIYFSGIWNVIDIKKKTTKKQQKNTQPGKYFIIAIHT